MASVLPPSLPPLPTILSIDGTQKVPVNKHPLAPAPPGATLTQMLAAVWPESNFFPNSNTDRPICSLNVNFSTKDCSFCRESSASFRDQIIVASNWLTGHHTKTPSFVHYTTSANYKYFISAQMQLKKLAEPFLPPSTPEEIKIFNSNHENVTLESDEPENVTIVSQPSQPSQTAGTVQLVSGITDVSILGPEIERKSDRFYFNYEGVHLTFPYHFDPVPYISHIRNEYTKNPGKVLLGFWSVVNEVGSTGHNHTHVALLFDRKFKHQSSRQFDYRESLTNPEDSKSVHPNIQAITGKVIKSEHRSSYQSHFQYFSNVVLYHRKQGTPITNVTDEDIQGMLLNTTTPEKKAKFGKLSLEEVKTVTSKSGLLQLSEEKKVDPRDLPKLMTAYEICKEHVDTVELRKVTSLYPLQEFILHYSSFSNDRTVTWIADLEGGVGKSYLSTYMVKNHNTFVLTTTSIQNAVRALKNHIDKKGHPTTIIVDLARSSLTGDDTTLYQTLETLKSQYITSTKYDSTVIEQKIPPSVLVFANSLPKARMLSLDRWVILIIGVIPGTIDYAFTGTTGYLTLTKFREYVDKLAQLNQENGVSQTLTVPIRSVLNVCNYPPEDKLSLEYRTSCWDKGMFPTYHCSSLPPSKEYPLGKYITNVTETPLTPDEILNYSRWKASQKDNNRKSIALADMSVDLDRQISLKLAEQLSRIKAQRSQSLLQPQALPKPQALPLLLPVPLPSTS